MSSSDAAGWEYALPGRAGESSRTSPPFEAGSFEASSFEAEVFVLDWAVAAEESAVSAPAPDEWGGLRNEGYAVTLDG